ncbi:hypothetical protein [Chondromyces crocatus]|uniref:Secreted protein n=1 Tax=Chondromyces crocatus TaxID=52 RepID=A0A0K1EJ84_CHOCO|nr:hypothetical protein [Chondromyces crocatus]AKT40732.1 uncharacterized protein CMC5_048880 [Chondromyces crocatus]
MRTGMTHALSGTGLLLLALAACSSNGTDDVGGGGQAAGGGQGGTTTSGGPGGAGGSESSCVPGPGSPCCSPDETSWIGTIDGNAVDGCYNATRIWPEGRYLDMEIDLQGVVRFYGAQTFTEDNVGSPVSASSIFRTPQEGPLAGTWFCSGQGTSVTRPPVDSSAGTSYTLASLSRLGTCSGTPVSGSVEICRGPSGTTSCSGSRSSLTGTIDGVAIDLTASFSGYSSSDDGVLTTWRPSVDDSGYSIVVISQQNTVVRGYIVTPIAGLDRGAVYCIGGGTASVPEPGSGGLLRATLTDLSFVGRCSEATPVEGEISASRPAP